MEKKVYELKINETLEHVMPPLQETELALLTKSLLEDGCRDPLIVWNGAIVDGHNRYRICQANNIPFSYIEMEFDDESAVKLWIIKNQLARRNVPDFVRCELVLPLEAELKVEAKKRQIRKAEDSVPPNLAAQKKGDSRDELARIAGVSHGTLDKVKKLVADADDETKEKLRNGEISIHSASKALKLKEKPDSGPPREATWGDIIPGYLGVEEILANSELPKGYTPPPDSALDIAPINADGTDLEDVDLDDAIAAELARHERRMKLILSKIEPGAFHDQEMIEDTYKRVMELFTRRNEI